MERSDEAGLIRAFLGLYSDLPRLLSWKTGNPDTGLAVAMLSVTGVIILYRKRRARLHRRR